jgi:hypothetical protein
MRRWFLILLLVTFFESHTVLAQSSSVCILPQSISDGGDAGQQGELGCCVMSVNLNNGRECVEQSLYAAKSCQDKEGAKPPPGRCKALSSQNPEKCVRSYGLFIANADPDSSGYCACRTGFKYDEGRCQPSASGASTATQTQKGDFFTPQVSIPFSKFQKGKAIPLGEEIITPTGEKRIRNALLQEYVVAIFSFMTIIAGFLAFIRIIIAGARWATAAGDGTIIANAQQSIRTSIVGVVALLASYQVLQLLSKNLVGFPSLDLATIGSQAIGQQVPLRPCSFYAKLPANEQENYLLDKKPIKKFLESDAAQCSLKNNNISVSQVDQKTKLPTEVGYCYADSCSGGGVCLYGKCMNDKYGLVSGFIRSGGSSKDFIHGQYMAAFRFNDIKFPANFNCAENAIVSIVHNGNDGFKLICKNPDGTEQLSEMIDDDNHFPGPGSAILLRSNYDDKTPQVQHFSFLHEKEFTQHAGDRDKIFFVLRLLNDGTSSKCYYRKYNSLNNSTREEDDNRSVFISRSGSLSQSVTFTTGDFFFTKNQLIQNKPLILGIDLQSFTRESFCSLK